MREQRKWLGTSQVIGVKTKEWGGEQSNAPVQAAGTWRTHCVSQKKDGEKSQSRSEKKDLVLGHLFLRSWLGITQGMSSIQLDA